jgi:hypothetical protein
VLFRSAHSEYEPDDDDGGINWRSIVLMFLGGIAVGLAVGFVLARIGV